MRSRVCGEPCIGARSQRIPKVDIVDVQVKPCDPREELRMYLLMDLAPLFLPRVERSLADIFYGAEPTLPRNAEIAVRQARSLR